MVNVGDKPATRRIAVATARVTMSRAARRMLDGRAAKGDVLAAARLAGIQAAKHTWELSPLCHPVSLSHASVELTLIRDGVLIEARAETVGKTGVEMEALTAASIAALTIYDMLKAVDRGMRIERVELLEKSGGQSGHWERKGRARA